MQFLDNAMKVGDIIRKTTASGLPIGQYMRIIKLDGDKATVIGDKTRNAFSMLVTHIHVYSKIAVQVSEEDYSSMKEILNESSILSACDNVYVVKYYDSFFFII